MQPGDRKVQSVGDDPSIPRRQSERLGGRVAEGGWITRQLEQPSPPLVIASHQDAEILHRRAGGGPGQTQREIGGEDAVRPQAEARLLANEHFGKCAVLAVGERLRQDDDRQAKPKGLGANRVVLGRSPAHAAAATEHDHVHFSRMIEV